jgi:hypothetical protein
MSHKVKFAIFGIMSVGAFSLYYFSSDKVATTAHTESEQRKEISLDEVSAHDGLQASANKKLESFIEANAEKHANLSDDEKVRILKEKIAELYPEDEGYDMNEPEIVLADNNNFNSDQYNTNEEVVVQEQLDGVQALEDRDSTEQLNWKE